MNSALAEADGRQTVTFPRSGTVVEREESGPTRILYRAGLEVVPEDRGLLWSERKICASLALHQIWWSLSGRFQRLNSQPRLYCSAAASASSCSPSGHRALPCWAFLFGPFGLSYTSVKGGLIVADVLPEDANVRLCGRVNLRRSLDLA